MVRFVSFPGVLLMQLSLINCFRVFAEVLLSFVAVVVVGAYESRADFLTLSMVFHG